MAPGPNPGTEEHMKLSNLAKSVVLGLAVLLATSAFASSKGSLHVQDPVEINGQQLPAGDYQLRWEGTGPNVEVSVMQGKKEVAKTSAKVIELPQTSAYDTAVVDRSSGKASLSEIRFYGKKYALALGGTEKAAMGDSSSR
jgi:hypothetical protein